MTKTLIPVTGKLDVNQSANENSLILFLLNLLKCAVSSCSGSVLLQVKKCCTNKTNY